MGFIFYSCTCTHMIQLYQVYMLIESMTSSVKLLFRQMSTINNIKITRNVKVLTLNIFRCFSKYKQKYDTMAEMPVFVKKKNRHWVNACFNFLCPPKYLKVDVNYEMLVKTLQLIVLLFYLFLFTLLNQLNKKPRNGGLNIRLINCILRL